MLFLNKVDKQNKTSITSFWQKYII